MPEGGLGRRLRQERERRKISLSTIAATTKISASLLAGLEREDLSRWPAGIFRRSFVRAYAEAIGIDADATVREVLERFPDPDEAAAAAASSELPPAATAKLRVRVVEAALSFRRGTILGERRRRWAAVAWDTGVLVAIAALLFVVVNSFWKPFGVVSLTYYVGGILLLGNTPGVCLFASTPESRGAGARWAPEQFEAGRIAGELRV